LRSSTAFVATLKGPGKPAGKTGIWQSTVARRHWSPRGDAAEGTNGLFKAFTSLRWSRRTRLISPPPSPTARRHGANDTGFVGVQERRPHELDPQRLDAASTTTPP